MARIDKTKSHDELYELAQAQASIIESYENEAALSSARMQAILSNLPLCLVIVNEQGAIEAINDRMLDTFFFKAEDVINEPVSILFDRPDMFEHLEGVVETAAVRNGGERFCCQVTRNDVEMTEDSKVLLHFEDITEQRRLEEIQKDFLEMVSHDVKNPLTSILGFLDMLHEGAYGDIPEKALRGATRTRETTQRLIDLISDLLNIDRMEQAQLEKSDSESVDCQ